MEIPEEQRDTLAYKCIMALRTVDKWSERYDIIRHYVDKNHAIGTHYNEKGHRMFISFNDGSFLFVEKLDNETRFGIICAENIPDILDAYYPFERVASMREML